MHFGLDSKELSIQYKELSDSTVRETTKIQQNRSGFHNNNKKKLFVEPVSPYQAWYRTTTGASYTPPGLSHYCTEACFTTPEQCYYRSLFYHTGSVLLAWPHWSWPLLDHIRPCIGWGLYYLATATEVSMYLCIFPLFVFLTVLCSCEVKIK